MCFRSHYLSRHLRMTRHPGTALCNLNVLNPSRSLGTQLIISGASSSMKPRRTRHSRWWQESPAINIKSFDYCRRHGTWQSSREGGDHKLRELYCKEIRSEAVVLVFASAAKRTKRSEKKYVGKWRVSLREHSQNCEKRLVVASCQPVRPSAWNNSSRWTDFDNIWYLSFFFFFSKICQENSSFIKIWQE